MEQPNYIRHYNHIGFQSYFVQPRMLETLDKLRFDCYRLGKVRENIEEIEPVLRNTDLFSVDICMIKHTDAPSHSLSPNGFSGEEACALSRYAGMSNNLSTYGIYGYNPAKDRDNLTAKQISQMLWYFLDGRHVRNKEAQLNERESFLNSISPARISAPCSSKARKPAAGGCSSPTRTSCHALIQIT